MELLYGEKCISLTSTLFDLPTRVTDGQTDGIAIAYARLAYMLSCAKNEKQKLIDAYGAF